MVCESGERAPDGQSRDAGLCALTYTRAGGGGGRDSGVFPVKVKCPGGPSLASTQVSRVSVVGSSPQVGDDGEHSRGKGAGSGRYDLKFKKESKARR